MIDNTDLFNTWNCQRYTLGGQENTLSCYEDSGILADKE